MQALQKKAPCNHTHAGAPEGAPCRNTTPSTPEGGTTQANTYWSSRERHSAAILMQALQREAACSHSFWHSRGRYHAQPHICCHCRWRHLASKHMQAPCNHTHAGTQERGTMHPYIFRHPTGGTKQPNTCRHFRGWQHTVIHMQVLQEGGTLHACIRVHALQKEAPCNHTHADTPEGGIMQLHTSNHLREAPCSQIHAGTPEGGTMELNICRHTRGRHHTAIHT